MLKNVKIIKNMAVCPRCNGNGMIYKTHIQELNQDLYVCDECEAIWENWIEIGWEINDFSTYLEERGFKYTQIKLSKENYNWINDSSLMIDKDYYKCPLLNIMIWMGDCYDINSVLDKQTKPSLLDALEKEIGAKVDLSIADQICRSCKHRMEEIKE